MPCGPIMKSIHSCSDIHWIWASKAAPQIFQLHLCGQRAWTVCVHEFESGLTHGAQTKSTKLQTWNWIQLTYKLPGLRLQEFQIRSLLNFSKQHKDSEKKNCEVQMIHVNMFPRLNERIGFSDLDLQSPKAVLQESPHSFHTLKPQDSVS